MGELRAWLRDAARGNPWVYRTPDEPLEIGPLISPLRFDVTIRAAFFDFYAANRALYREDFDAFARRAREEEYFVWFERVMCPTWQPHVLADPARFDAAWAQRLQATARLYDSFARRGFDRRFPITLHAARRVLPTASGRRVARPAYTADGNHRLALLLAAGRRALRPGEYRVKVFRRLVPIDTTPFLLEVLDVDRRRYADFLKVGRAGAPG